MNTLVDNNNVIKLFKKGLKKTSTLPHKYMVYFWFLGPFIYLIERTPGDVWLSAVVVTFLIKSLIKNDWEWARQAWFKITLLFWIFSLISALQGPMPIFSIEQGFVWIRFPIYAAAVQSWIATERNVRFSMIMFLIFTSVIMSCILFAEVFYLYTLNDQNSFTQERLSWPYGDLVPGNFIAKACMPAIVVMTAISINKINLIWFFIIIISITAVALTGERTSLLLTVCASIFASFSWKPNLKLLIIIGLLLLLSITAVFNMNDLLYVRFTSDLINSIPILNMDTSYWGTWRSGLQQGLENLWLGVGPTGSRYTCGHLGPHWLPGTNYCGNHPHNFYIQLFAETGIIGLILGIIMIYQIFKVCWISRINNPSCVLSGTAYIIPLAMFFPFQQTGSFFGQWNNLFMWFAIGFAISNYRILKNLDERN